MHSSAMMRRRGSVSPSPPSPLTYVPASANHILLDDVLEQNRQLTERIKILSREHAELSRTNKEWGSWQATVNAREAKYKQDYAQLYADSRQLIEIQKREQLHINHVTMQLHTALTELNVMNQRNMMLQARLASLTASSSSTPHPPAASTVSIPSPPGGPPLTSSPSIPPIGGGSSAASSTHVYLPDGRWIPSSGRPAIATSSSYYSTAAPTGPVPQPQPPPQHLHPHPHPQYAPYGHMHPQQYYQPTPSPLAPPPPQQHQTYPHHSQHYYTPQSYLSGGGIGIGAGAGAGTAPITSDQVKWAEKIIQQEKHQQSLLRPRQLGVRNYPSPVVEATGRSSTCIIADSLPEGTILLGKGANPAWYRNQIVKSSGAHKWKKLETTESAELAKELQPYQMEFRTATGRSLTATVMCIGTT